ncbi:MAG TPA: hypothetical protein VF530_15490 [Planctomycetota bacterium]
MRPWHALPSLLLLAWLPTALGGQAARGPTWHDDLAQAFALASETGKPLLLVFR